MYILFNCVEFQYKTKYVLTFSLYLYRFARWFCHFDDDNYVNVPRLVKLLDEYSPTVDWYLGKPSISSPLEIHLDSVSCDLFYCFAFSYLFFLHIFQYSRGNYTIGPWRDRLSPALALFMRLAAPGHLSMPPFGFQLPA